MAKQQTATKSAPAAATAPLPGAAPQEGAGALVSRSTGLVARVAARFGIDPDKMLDTLKQTAFRQRPPQGGGEAKPVTNEQMLMLLVVAEEYHLNPFTREIYAFPQDGGIVPIIGVDGWIRMINEHPHFRSLELQYPDPADVTDPNDYWVTCVIERDDREKPIIVTEWLKECYRDTNPWNTMPKRMVRHKAIVQCGRVAFGFAGVYDPDEAERIYAAAINVTPRGKPETRPPQAKKPAPEVTDVDTRTPPPAGEVNQDPPAPAITLDQATYLADSLKEEGLALSLFLANFEIGSVEDLTVAKYENAVAWILGGGK